MNLNRRGFLTGVAGAAALSQALPGIAEAATAEDHPTGQRVRLRQGTDIAARISPDGKQIAFDLVGVLWLVPAAGGKAKRLTSDLFDLTQPDWAPDGRTLVFQSYRDGAFNLWTIHPDGSGLRQLTEGPFDHREPRYSPDGTKIAFSSDLGGSYGIHTLDLGTGKITTIADTTAEEYEPAWSPDGSKLAFVVDNTKIDVVTVADGTRSTAVTVPAGQVIHNPEWTPDGTDLLYSLVAGGKAELMRGTTALVTGEEVFPFRASFHGGEFVYTADGAIRRRALAGGAATDIPFEAEVTVQRPDYRKRRRDFDSLKPRPVVGIASPVLSPDGRSVAFRALNDIYTMRVGEPPRPLTRDHWWKSDPAWSPDGRYLSYATDRGGKLDIWIRDLRTGADRQLTNLPNAAAVSGSWSRDGSKIAFLDQTGAVHTVDVADGTVKQIYAATFEPGRPTWSADGRTVALAAIKPYSARYREGLSKILLVDVASGAGRYVDPMPHRSLQTRGDDGPVWSPDGTRMAFVVASVLWVTDVHPDGTFAGAPRRITDEVTDAPSWSGDSKSLLYLNNGRLRLIGAGGGHPRTVPVGLRWANVRGPERLVVHAGRMWDGVSDSLRSNVDIVVEGHRITAVRAHREADTSARHVDAHDGVVIPGLIDMHNHREMQGYSYGDRQGRLWLALGITTTRSPGSPAYHMVEDRESVQSGARVAPRYFATGEAVDGGRIFYNFMRPTFDESQVRLELERAAALDYDLMKCYVRLSTERQQEVVEWAHRHGIPATSHYHYPAFAFGGDGMEHIGATNRFGFSRTVTTLGTGYSDVIDIFNAANASRTPTFFGSAALFRDDQSLVTDERVRTLYPSWEYASLQAAATTAQTTDQTVNLANLRRQVEQALAIVRGGGTVVTGTDSPIDHTAVSTHMNLRAMVAYGFTPVEALRTATSTSGGFLGEPLGRIAPGCYADLTVLGGDPLADIREAANVRSVVVNGLAYTVEELVAPFATAKPTVAAQRVAPAPEHPANAGFWWHDPHYLAESKRSCCAER